MTTRRLIKLAAALLVGLGAADLELAVRCASAATSEACVWGRAYLPVTRVAYPLVLVPLAYLVLSLLERAARPRRDRRDGGA